MTASYEPTAPELWRQDLARTPAWVLIRLKDTILLKQKAEDDFEKEKKLLRQERKELEEYKTKIQGIYSETTKENDKKVLNYVNELQEWKEKECDSVKREILQKNVELEHKEFELRRYKEREKQLLDEVEALKQGESKADSNSKELQKLKDEIAVKDNDIIELENNILSKQDWIDDLNQRVEKTNKEFKVLQEDQRNKDKLIEDLNEEVAVLRNEIISLKQTVASLNSGVKREGSFRNNNNSSGNSNNNISNNAALENSSNNSAQLSSSGGGGSFIEERRRRFSQTSPPRPMPPAPAAPRERTGSNPPKPELSPSSFKSVDTGRLSPAPTPLPLSPKLEEPAILSPGKRELWKSPSVSAISCRISWLDANMKSNAILNLLVREDMSLVNALRDILEGEELNTVASALVHLSDASSKRVLKYLIQDDVHRSLQVSGFLRSNGLASKVVAAYSNVVGGEYLKSTLYPVIQDIIASKQSYEIDPAIVSDEKVRSLNCVALMSTIKRVVQWLLDSARNFPTAFHELAEVMWGEVSKKYNEEECLRALSIWVFGRFFAPAIYAPPESFAFSDVTTDSRKLLLTISRVVQHIGYGNAFKEKHMTLINSVLAEFWPNMKTFLYNLKTQKPAPGIPSTSPKSRLVLQMTSKEAIKRIARAMITNKQKIIEHLKVNRAPTITNTYHFRTFDRLSHVCADIGVPSRDKKITIKQTDPKAEEFVKLFLEEPKVIAELAPLSQQFNEGDKFAQSIVILCHSNNNLELVPEYVKSFLAEDLAKTQSKLNDGIAGKIFSTYANLVGADYLTTSLSLLVSESTEHVSENKKGGPNLQELLSKFLKHILSSIHKIPFPVWDICHHIYTTVGPKKGVELVTSFLFSRFLCPAILNPEAYCYFAEEPSKKFRKFFNTIADMISKIAAPDPGSDECFSTYYMQEREVLYKIIDTWMTRPASVPPPPQAPEGPFPWAIQEEAIRYLHRALYENLLALSHKLGEVGVTNTVTHTMTDMIDQLVTPLLLDEL